MYANDERKMELYKENITIEEKTRTLFVNSFLLTTLRPVFPSQCLYTIWCAHV